MNGPLDDTPHSKPMWARFKTILWWMTAVAVAVSVLAVYLIGRSLGELKLPVIIATFAGSFFSIMMTAGLMGLMFLSSSSGHDEDVIDPVDDDAKR